MKKMLCVLLAILMVCSIILPVYGSEISDVPSWYELTSDESGADILTVRLESNPTTGYDWSFEISDPELLELLTQEYVSDQQDSAMCGVGGTWIASFRNFSGKSGVVTIEFEYSRSWEDAEGITEILEMQIDENGKIVIVSDGSEVPVTDQ